MPSDGDSRAGYEAMGREGWIGLHWPEALGGRSLDPLMTVAAEERFGYHWLPLSGYLLSLEPGRPTRILLELDGIAQAVPAGHRLRLALSPAYWPWLWPVPEPVTLAVHTSPSSLVLPVRPARPEDAELRPFEEPEGAAPLKVETVRPDAGGRTMTRDFESGRTELTFDWATGGLHRLVEAGLSAGCWATTTYSIFPGDPLTAEVRCETATELGRDDWTTRTEIRAVMNADTERFRVRTELEAFENGESVRRREWSFETPRDLG